MLIKRTLFLRRDERDTAVGPDIHRAKKHSKVLIAVALLVIKLFFIYS
jgi:hypothetical protein